MASYSGIIADASQYVREGIIDKWQKWIMLIICSLVQMITCGLVPLLSGYSVRVYAGEKEAPEVNDWGKLFIDGWKITIITILYMIPAIIVGLFLGGISIFSIVSVFTDAINSGKIERISELLLGSFGLLLAALVIVIISLIMFMGFVHFGRSGKMIDAFSVGELTAKISEGIGWGAYVLLWILIWIFAMIYLFIVVTLNLIPLVGILAGIVLAPLWAIFIAKILTNAYDNLP